MEMYAKIAKPVVFEDTKAYKNLGSVWNIAQYVFYPNRYWDL